MLFRRIESSKTAGKNREQKRERDGGEETPADAERVLTGVLSC